MQGVVEKAIEEIVGGSVRLMGSGRTDAGVHAKGQVANFHTNNPIPVDRWVFALNCLLPPDVVVTNAEEVPTDFHAQYSAVGKTYYYYIWNNICQNTFLRNYSHHVRRKLRLSAMEEAASYLKGTHNFRSYCSSGSSVKNFVRTIKAIDFETREQILIFQITADGFLYKMVRTIVGTLLEIGMGKYPPEWIKEVLSARSREAAGPTAPAHGLFLQEVFYG